MLSISKMSSGSAWYYTTLAREDYYLKGGEPPGIWWGSGAADLGLSGQVGSAELKALYQGFAPDGRQLVQNAGSKDRQSGWDLTFSAPKPVSTLWSQGDADLRHEIQAAHLEVVKTALAYVQEEVALTRRGKAGIDKESARLIVAIYEHGTSRELDPNLHSHALVMNACKREDGTDGTILSKPFYQHKLAAGALYRAELAAQLVTRLGVRCGLDERGFAFLIEGVSQELNKIFSKRREAIERRLESRGLESASAAAVSALATRMIKGEIPSREKLFPMWRAVGKALGFDPGQALGREHRTINSLPEFEKVLHESLENITASEGHFTKKELLRQVSIQAQGRCLSGSFIRAQLREALEHSKEIRALGDWRGDFRYTTRSVLDLEKELIKSADSLKEKRVHGASDKIIARAIENAAKPMTEEQKEAVRHVTRKEAGLRSLEGLAGTGKTSTLAVAREALEKAGYSVLGAATSAKAAREMEEGAGIKSATIESLTFRMHPTMGYRVYHHMRQLARAAMHKPTFKLKPLKFNKNTVLVLDEAAMISTRELAKLVTAVEKGSGMLITVFDRKQLQAIGPGGGAAFLADRHGKAELTNIVRQKNQRDIEAVRAFASGRADEALQNLAERGKVHVAKNREAALSKLISDWAVNDYGKREGALIFVGTRAEARDANERCQAARLRNGEIAGKCASLAEASLYQSDRVLFTKNSKTVGVENGSLGTVTGLKSGSSIAVVKLDSGVTVQVPLKSYKSLELGYAVTTHKGQGTTVDNAYILAGGSMQNRELSYVQASRARESTQLYTDRHEAGKNLSGLAKQMNKSQEKTLAHDVLTRQQQEGESLQIKKGVQI